MQGARHVGSVFDKYQVRDTQWMAKKGDKFYTLDPAERDKWAKRILPIRNEWIQDVKGKGINGERLLETGLRLMSEKSK